MPCVQTVFVFSFGLGSGRVGAFLQFQDEAEKAFRKIQAGQVKLGPTSTEALYALCLCNTVV